MKIHQLIITFGVPVDINKDNNRAKLDCLIADINELVQRTFEQPFPAITSVLNI